MAEIAFLCVYVAILAIPALAVTVIVVSIGRIAVPAHVGSRRLIVAAGSIVPIAMLLYGGLLAWPWPWREPAVQYDMVPPGPGLMLGAFPVWLASLAVSWAVLRGRASSGGGLSQGEGAPPEKNRGGPS